MAPIELAFSLAILSSFMGVVRRTYEMESHVLCLGCQVLHAGSTVAEDAPWLWWGCWFSHLAYCHHCALNAQPAWQGLVHSLSLGELQFLLGFDIPVLESFLVGNVSLCFVILQFQ